MVEVKKMFANFITYRSENSVDSLLERFDFPELETIRQYFPHAYHGLDKIGRPINLERMGRLDTEKLQ